MSILGKTIRKTVFSTQKLKTFNLSKYCSQLIQPKSEPPKQTKPYLKKIKQPPFVKNLFIGSFNKDVLIYPEVLSRENLSELNKTNEKLKTFFTENVNIHQMDVDNQISDEIMNELKKMSLFSIMVPMEYGGLGFTFTEYARLAETIGRNPTISRILSAHELMGIQSILTAGNKEQKEKFISKLSSGEYIAAFCLTELDSGYDPASISTLAEFTDDRKKLVLNGKKAWVTNGNIADIFIVVAKLFSPERQCENIGLIIVEKNSEGITLGTPEKSLGLTSCNICSVEFKDTIIPAKNLLSSDDVTTKHLLDIFGYGMFGIGASTIGFLKELFDKTVNHVIHRNLHQRPMVKNELIQEKLGKISSKIYAIESMVYLTAGMLDMTEEPDCNIENAILKIFGAEQTWCCVNICIELLGARSYFKNYPYERYLRDSLAWKIVEGSSDMLKMYISLTGLKYAGFCIAKDVKKLRNPLFNPVFIFKKMIKDSKFLRNNFTLTMNLAGHLHPSLRRMADNLERNTIKFQHTVEVIFRAYGQDIVNKEIELKRIAEIAMELYAMTAVLSRSSRSYCIGLQHSEIELNLATVYCFEAHTRISAMFQQIIENIKEFNDDFSQEIASKLINYKGYVIEDPLKYNW